MDVKIKMNVQAQSQLMMQVASTNPSVLLTWTNEFPEQTNAFIVQFSCWPPCCTPDKNLTRILHGTIINRGKTDPGMLLPMLKNFPSHFAVIHNRGRTYILS